MSVSHDPNLTNHIDDPDALLQSFLIEADDRKSNRIFEEIFRTHAAWLRRLIASDAAATGDIDDILQNVQIKLWRVLESQRLTKIRHGGGTQPGTAIRNLRAYVKRVAKTVVIDMGPRQECREYANLLRKVRNLASHGHANSPFGIWNWDGALLFGFQAWVGDLGRHATFQSGRAPGLSTATLSELDKFVDRHATAIERGDLPLMVGLVLKWLDAPVRFTELVEWIAAVMGFNPVRLTLETDLRDEEGELPESYGGATEVTPETEVVGVADLRAAFQQLPPNSQLVLICDLDIEDAKTLTGSDTFGGYLEELAGRAGAHIDAVARSTDRLCEMLSLTDEQTARLLRTTVGNVHVLRSRARKLLAKKLQTISTEL